ncbi:MAG: signal peptidase II [Gemmatimonadetes bacterium RIFCSPLOWO2_12_FULL_68_9]|nr:MAG: signal peptidase II [Gemmatimonadetes bacterium RIFCSPLOWO2_12_FULL_68_9]
MVSGANRSFFWMVASGVVVLDFLTKRLAVATLAHRPVPLAGDWLSFQLVYNPGAAFGIHVGGYSRWVFMALAIVALVVLGSMVRQTDRSQPARLVALGLVCGGAVGNLIDRITSARGVVDFIDVWIGPFHWPTFNVADMAVSCGAVLLALILWNEGRRGEPARGEQADVAGAS